MRSLLAKASVSSGGSLMTLSACCSLRLDQSHAPTYVLTCRRDLQCLCMEAKLLWFAADRVALWLPIIACSCTDVWLQVVLTS